MVVVQNGNMEVGLTQIHSSGEVPPLQSCHDGPPCFHFEFLFPEETVQPLQIQYSPLVPVLLGYKEPY